MQPIVAVASNQTIICITTKSTVNYERLDSCRNDLILADRELEVGFIGQLDALFEGIERMDASHKASPSNEQFLTDKEVSVWLKVSRRTLQDYRNNGMVSYYQLGGKILYKESDIEKLLMSGYRNAYRMET